MTSMQIKSPLHVHPRLVLAVVAQNDWEVNSMDIKTAFLQGEPIDRDVFIRPPKEASCNGTVVWKLKKCVYGVNDASLRWYKRVKSVMKISGANVSKVDPAVFYWCSDSGEVYCILACHVDHFVWGGSSQFEEVISEIRSAFNVGKECNAAFRYCGIDISSDGEVFHLDQGSYTSALNPIQIDVSRSSDKTAKLTESEKTCVEVEGWSIALAYTPEPTRYSV